MMIYKQTIKQCMRLAIIPIFVLCFSCPAAAGELDDFDANQDGQITFEEVMKHLEPSVRKSFDILDRNHDGVLSGKDFDDVHEGMQQLEEWLKELIRPLLQEPENESVEV